MGLVDVEGVMVDAGMSLIGDEVKIEVMVQSPQDLLILKLIMFAESEVIWPMIVHRKEI